MCIWAFKAKNNPIDSKIDVIPHNEQTSFSINSSDPQHTLRTCLTHSSCRFHRKCVLV